MDSYNTSSINRAKTLQSVRGNYDETKKLIKIISPFIPKFMKYKIGGKNE